MISRRGFLAGLAAAFVADPERLLWVKSKTISIPAPAKVLVGYDPEMETIRYTHTTYGMSVVVTREVMFDAGRPTVEAFIERELLWNGQRTEEALIRSIFGAPTPSANRRDVALRIDPTSGRLLASRLPE